MRLTSLRGRAARRGFTLIEMLIAITLFAVLAGGVLGVLRRQSRFYRGARDQLAQRSSLRMALGVMPADLRGMSSVGGDIYQMADRRVDFRQSFGTSFVCVMPVAGGTTIILPPRTLAKGTELTNWIRIPEVGDSLLIYDDNTAVGDWDDTWRVYRVNAIAQVTGVNACPTTTGYTAAADAVTPSWQITLNANLTNTMQVGAPVRFFRRVQYQLYQAADAKWYLGWADCLDTRVTPCSAMQPVSGPYKAYTTAPGLSGLSLAYYDSTGAVTANRLNVARIDVVVRADERATTDNSASYSQGKKDSLTTVVGLRNRS